jgi:type I restriction enzyme R subunit
VHFQGKLTLEGELDEGHVYTEKDFNRRIIIEERERKRVQEMLEAINPDEKTIVFCANQAHAGMVRDLINQEADSTSVDYCARVTANDGAIGDGYLKQFQDNEKTIPTILTTSQKLTTGVDARNVRNIVLLRPINSMIEFKQIIGRGTRLFEGKHFFTIVDFVNAYHLFSDKEWDGEPEGGQSGDGGDDGEKGDGETRDTPPGRGGGDDVEKKPKLRIRLSDGKVRELKSMSSTYFFVDGAPISAEEFLKRLFDTIKLPELLGSEERLRKLWSSPVTRRELLQRLEDAGCLRDDLEKLQELIDAQDSDLFDVLEYIAYAKPPISRAARVETNRSNIFNLLNEAQQEFVGYVLRNYVAEGIDELDVSKLSTVLQAKYGGIDAAEAALGEVVGIRETFVSFQERLYSA